MIDLNGSDVMCDFFDVAVEWNAKRNLCVSVRIFCTMKVSQYKANVKFTYVCELSTYGQKRAFGKRLITSCNHQPNFASRKKKRREGFFEFIFFLL